MAFRRKNQFFEDENEPLLVPYDEELGTTEKKQKVKKEKKVKKSIFKKKKNTNDFEDEIFSNYESNKEFKDLSEYDEFSNVDKLGETKQFSFYDDSESIRETPQGEPEITSILTLEDNQAVTLNEENDKVDDTSIEDETYLVNEEIKNLSKLEEDDNLYEELKDENTNNENYPIIVPQDDIEESKLEELAPDFDSKKINVEKLTKTLNILLLVIFILIFISSIDIILISKYNKGPFFAIKTKIYNDGGTRQYYGFGYKVIKYHQKQGRRDTTIGSWFMPYQGDATTLQLIDLAINLREKPKDTYRQIVKKFIRVSGVITNIDKKKNTITISYVDDDGKYSLNIDCILDENSKKISEFSQGATIYVIGTVDKFELRSKEKVNTLSMINCFVEE